MPLMQHYIALLEKHVRDNEEIDDATKRLVHQNIGEAQHSIADLAAEEIHSKTDAFEGVVFKESEGGWKERYLILRDGFLTMVLAKGREAANGGDRSKKIPLDAILSVVPVGSEAVVGDKWVFAISTTTSSAILMAAPTEEQRDLWIGHLMDALNLN